MTDVTGIDHTDITVSDLDRSESFSDDYCATFFTDPDGVRLEVTNWRQERRERAAHWDDPQA